MPSTPTPPRGALSEAASKALLDSFGIPVIREITAPTKTGAVAAARKIGFPVALKANGATLLHKTERGLVHLNLPDATAVETACDALQTDAGNALENYLIQPHLTGQREFVAGMFRDPQFGPVIMFGLGGTLTEALADVTFRLAPLTRKDAENMLAEIRAQKLLDAFRGEPPVRRTALVDILRQLAHIAETQPDVAEIDINPLIVRPTGEVVAVDALVVRNPPAAGETSATPSVDINALGALFHPRSIAFVGASGQFGKWGHMLFTITAGSGFAGPIYLVNPKGGTIAGRKVYKSVNDIDDTIDLAVVTVPAQGVTDLIPHLAAKKIRYMVLISSGFGETGEAGKKLEQRLIALARQKQLLILGPNTMGICNPHRQLYCTGSHVRPLAGSTAMVAQSGNMGTQLLAFAEQQGIGIRAFAGSGNEAMITIEDYLEAFEVDTQTRTVMLYVESVKNGRRFYESARRVSAQKPIILLKGGQSTPGNRAAASHTGAMSTDTAVFEAVCRQAGIIKVEQPMDLLDLSAAFSSLPLPAGNRIAIMTLGGGWGVVTADLCARYGLDVPLLADNIVTTIDKILPPYWSRANPIDIVGEFDPAIPLTVLENLLQWDQCDAVINLGILGRRILLERLTESVAQADPTYTREFLDKANAFLASHEQQWIEQLTELMETYEKPVIGVSLLTDAHSQTVYRIEDRKYKGIFYETPERAVKALARMHRYRCFLET